MSFEGTCDGKPVIGYTASNLTALGMEDFADLLADPRKLERLHGDGDFVGVLFGHAPILRYPTQSGKTETEWRRAEPFRADAKAA